MSDKSFRPGQVIQRVAPSTDRVTRGKTYLVQKCPVQRRGKWPGYKLKIKDDNGEWFQPANKGSHWRVAKIKQKEIKMTTYKFIGDSSSNFTNGKLYHFNGAYTRSDKNQNLMVTLVPSVWEKIPQEKSEVAAQSLGEWAGAQAVIGQVREFIAQAEEKLKKLGKEYEEENANQKAGLDRAINELHKNHNQALNRRERALEVRRTTIHEERQELADWVCRIEQQMGEKE